MKTKMRALTAATAVSAALVTGITAVVRAAQDQINFRNNKDGHTLTVDDIFGPKTAAAVRAFQRAMSIEVPGFAVDGIVAPQTWQALVTEALSG
jgi:peptidoglycan hydrolase-like protein with peptidoglycan-binding domain